jgi:hypothetical protein
LIDRNTVVVNARIDGREGKNQINIGPTHRNRENMTSSYFFFFFLSFVLFALLAAIAE